MRLPQFNAEASIYRSTRHYAQVAGRTTDSASVVGHLQPAINYPYGMGPEAPCPWPCHYKPIYTIYGLRYECVCSGSDNPYGGSDVCPSGATWCGGKCVDLSNDPDNCGSCGKFCGGMCQGGQCWNFH